jgi:hypothetical protein
MLKRVLNRRFVALAVLAAFALFLIIQVVPMGVNHVNPPVLSEPSWDSPETVALHRRACADCHSNETVWPWYSNVAPMSWLLQKDVDEARSGLNFSEWEGQKRIDARLVRDMIETGAMPPSRYVMLHPEARLSQAEKEQLAQGLEKTLGQP